MCCFMKNGKLQSAGYIEFKIVRARNLFLETVRGHEDLTWESNGSKLFIKGDQTRLRQDRDTLLKKAAKDIKEFDPGCTIKIIWKGLGEVHVNGKAAYKHVGNCLGEWVGECAEWQEF